MVKYDSVCNENSKRKDAAFIKISTYCNLCKKKKGRIYTFIINKKPENNNIITVNVSQTGFHQHAGKIIHEQENDEVNKETS